MQKSVINVNSEIGRLKSILLKRPGAEIENITPATMNHLLFDDIPYLKIAQSEHDAFANSLRAHGTEVVYLEELMAAVCAQSTSVKTQFIKQFLAEANYTFGTTYEALSEYLNQLSPQTLIKQIYAGVRRDAITFKNDSLHDLAGQDAANPYVLNPLPNAYFTRDPQAVIGNGITINRLTYSARQPESLITEYVMKYHPRFAGLVNIWRNRNNNSRIEGGDEFILNEHVLAMGISQRTSSRSIEGLARELFANPAAKFDTIIAVEIPHNHAMMHLDTVFTMINYDQFSVFPGMMDAEGQLNIFVITPGPNNTLKLVHHTNLAATLKAVLKLSELDLIETGGGDAIVGPREQWNDGSNTLAIAPGEVITYDRNYVTNELLRQHGIIVHEVPSSELSRGRGGPRCMSQPLWREDL